MDPIAIDCPGCGANLDTVTCACTAVGCIHEISACFAAYLTHTCTR